MNLGELHALISSNIGRGNVFDTVQIPAKVQQSARWLEQNKNMKHMERFVSFTLNPNADAPRFVSFPSSRVKSINFVRILLDDGSFKYLTQVDPAQVTAVETAEPIGYFLAGYDYIVLDNNPDKAYQIEVGYYEYTAWPAATNIAATNWLLENAGLFLEAQAMILMAPILRDPDMPAAWKLQRDEALRVLTSADEESFNTNRSEAMQVNLEGVV